MLSDFCFACIRAIRFAPTFTQTRVDIPLTSGLILSEERISTGSSTGHRVSRSEYTEHYQLLFLLSLLCLMKCEADKEMILPLASCLQVDGQLLILLVLNKMNLFILLEDGSVGCGNHPDVFGGCIFTSVILYLQWVQERNKFQFVHHQHHNLVCQRKFEFWVLIEATRRCCVGGVTCLSYWRVTAGQAADSRTLSALFQWQRVKPKVKTIQ